MTVKIILASSVGKRVMGTLSLIDGRIVAHPPDSTLLQNILKGDYMIYKNGKPQFIDPKLDPVGFLENLHRYYSGKNLWATKAE